ncbi:MAG: hypothetical protein PHX51_02255 [Clostridia bacterium]|nr:hypothetical protein [Clostridia bacterium]
MYDFVDSAEIKPYKSFCAKTMEQLRDTLREENDINSQFYLIGSGAKNLVTQNENEPYDLDYNLLILTAPQEYWNDLKRLKDEVRNTLNQIVGKTLFSDGQDSTSVITSKLHFTENEGVEFSFDIGILAENKNGNLCRLIHEKNRYGFTNQDRFYWNECPSSHNVKEIADILKEHNLWEEVRQTYLDKKNMYLRRNDRDHPSFVVYVETVNEVYVKHGGK